MDGAEFNLTSQLSIGIGTRWVRPFLVWSDAARTTPDPLTGLTASSLEIFDSAGTVLLTLAGTITTGSISFTATVAQTAAFSAGRYEYRIRNTYGSGEVFPFLKGVVDAE